MQIIRSIAQLRAWRKTAGRLAFVPTMGNLHAGHLALVEAARQHADKVVDVEQVVDQVKALRTQHGL